MKIKQTRDSVKRKEVLLPPAELFTSTHADLHRLWKDLMMTRRALTWNQRAAAQGPASGPGWSTGEAEPPQNPPVTTAGEDHGTSRAWRNPHLREGGGPQARV